MCVLGYSTYHKGYISLSKSRKVFISTFFKFNENDFSFKTDKTFTELIFPSSKPISQLSILNFYLPNASQGFRNNSSVLTPINTVTDSSYSALTTCVNKSQLLHSFDSICSVDLPFFNPLLQTSTKTPST